MQFVEIGRRRPPRYVGTKAEGLAWLSAHGYPIPRTWVLPWDALSGGTSEREIMLALERIVDEARLYAVRCSVQIDEESDADQPECFETALNLRGLVAVASAIAQVVSRANTARLSRRMTTLEAPLPELEMAVIVQEMVRPQVSGVAFSANPLTAFDEVVVEAVRGSGDSLVQDSVTPPRWVRKWGNWRERPIASDIPQFVIDEVATRVAEMGRRNGWPVDVEWAWDGESVSYLTMREISTFDGVSVYSSRLPREFWPGIIPPLVWDVNLPIISGAWVRLLTEMVGETGLAPEDLARSFYYRAYFNMGALGRVFDLAGLPRNSLELLALGEEIGGDDRPRFRLTARSILRAPRAIGFAAGKVRLRAQVEAEIPRIQRRLRDYLTGPTPEDLTAKQVLDRIEELVPIVQDAAYLNVVAPLATEVYSRLLSKRLLDFELEIDEIDFGNPDTGSEGRDPGPALTHLAELYEQLPPGTRKAVAAGRVERIQATKSGSAFLSEVDLFVERYGHFSNASNDLSVPRWREDVPTVLRSIPARAEEKRTSTHVDRERLAQLGAPDSVLRALDRVARWRAMRERVASLYSLAYGQLRPLYLRLGDILLRRDWIERIDDIFMLTADELAEALLFDVGQTRTRELIATRSAEIEEMRDAAVPDIIFGDEAPPLANPDHDALRGTPASSGYHVGRAIRVDGPADAVRVQRGDVVVVPYVDAEVTPLLGMAGAIVTETGGFLSPCSVTAREQQIPAVVACQDAMTRIPDGARVAVDGFKGSVALLVAAEAAEPTVSAAEHVPGVGAAS